MKPTTDDELAEPHEEHPRIHGESVAQHLSERITFRVTETEKWILKLLADQEGLSIGRFVMKLARSAGRSGTDRLRESVDRLREQEAARRKRTKRRNGRPTRKDLIGRFRCPFLRREHAEDFEAIISESAERMGVSPLSAARFTSFLIEAIATRVASGKVVRVPGFGTFGPWYSEKAKAFGCLPRFVASEPLRRLVESECHTRDNRNQELKAAQRRRRHRRSSTVDAMETLRRHIGAQNNEVQAAFERWIEMGS